MMSDNVKEPGINHDLHKGCAGCGKQEKSKEQFNGTISLVDDLFKTASMEVRSEELEQYKAEIKNKLKQKKAAELLLSNINREITELRFRINQELV